MYVFLCLTSLSMITSRSIHIASNDIFSLSFYGSVIYHSMCIYHIFFTHSSVDGYLDCFHVLAIVNSVGLKLGCMQLLKLEFYQSICPSVGLLDHMVILI